ncbi:MAG: glycosyltransferase family 4 protein [Chitinophagaceae bacterium]
MNIWVICFYATPIKYFFGTRHFYLGKEWVKSNNKVTIFTSNSSHLTCSLPKFKGKSYTEKIDGVDTIWLNTLSHNSTSNLKRILSWFHFEWQLFTLNKCKIDKPDVIIVSSLSLLSAITGIYYSWKYKCKFVFEVRDIWPLSPIILGGFSKWHPFMIFLAFIEKFAYQKADRIVGTIPNLQLHLNNLGINKTAYCIPQGIDLEYYLQKLQQTCPIEISNQLPIDKFIIGYAGTINANNPLENLISAAEILKGEEVYFAILGDGNQREKLKEIAKELNLTKVFFFDSIAKNQVNAFLQKITVAYDSFDSTLADYGLSRNKWIDYMYAEKPIICSFSGYQSMINECNGGTFVPFHDVNVLANTILEYSCKTKAELKSMGARCKNFIVEERSFDKLAKNYISII